MKCVIRGRGVILNLTRIHLRHFIAKVVVIKKDVKKLKCHFTPRLNSHF